MKREIDFEILAEKINDSDLYEFVAFSNNVPVEAVNRDLDSIKEALNSHDKIFLEIGFTDMMMNTVMNLISCLMRMNP